MDPKTFYRQLALGNILNTKMLFRNANYYNIFDRLPIVSDLENNFNTWCYNSGKWALRILLGNTVAQKTLLALCGDVESNPGPPTKKKSKEKPPDEKQVMKEKVERHDAKVDEFEALIRAQAESLEELKQKQVELVRGMEEQKVEHQQRVEEVKVEAANHLNEMKSAMESQMAEQKVHMEANELESKTSMAEMNTELKASQAELIRQQAEDNTKMEQNQLEFKQTIEELKDQHQRQIDENKVEADNRVSMVQSNLEIQLSIQKATHEEDTKGLRLEVTELRRLLNNQQNSLGSKSEDTSKVVRDLETSVEEIQEKIWELDKSWKNNLVFYGIRSDTLEEHPSVTESKIREILSRQMYINREIPISRCRRGNKGPEVRGSKPILVCFEKYTDKDEILRKAAKLRGTNIYVGEDFSKRVKDQRHELQKFLKAVKRKRPNSTFKMQFDKLIVDNEIYMYNDLTGQVEQVYSPTLRAISPNPGSGMGSSMGYADGMPYAATPQFGSTASLRAPSPGSAPAEAPRTRRIGSRGEGRGRRPKQLQKSFSTESSLNHMVPNSPIHPDAGMGDSSREVSPTKGNRTPGRKLSPPKHLEAPIVEVTENDSSNEESKEQPATEEQPQQDVDNEKTEENKDEGDNKEQNGQPGETNGGLSEATSEDEIITDMSQLNNGYDSAAAVAAGIRKSIPDIPETIAE